MRKDIFSYFTVIAIVLISTLILWFPFLIRAGSWFGLSIANSNFQYIYKQYDGPLYIIPAKTFYNPILIDKLHLEISLPDIYFAAHLPLYPLFIAIFANIMGFLKSMIFVNILFTILLSLLFYFIVTHLKLSKNPLILTSIFLFLPRFLVVRSVGAPESLFIFLLLLSLFFFEKENYLLAGVLGGLVTMAKTPGILLFIAYLLVIIERYINSKSTSLIKYIGLFLIPLGLLGVFWLYAIQYKDFFAYFHSGDNIHLVAPFSVFNFQSRWVGTAWLDDVIFYFFLYLMTVIALINFKYRSFFYYSLIFFIATIFVQHRDIARYSLPLWPLACFAFEKFFTSKKFLIAFLILLPGIYLYAWNFLLYNIMPISNWFPFL